MINHEQNLEVSKGEIACKIFVTSERTHLASFNEYFWKNMFGKKEEFVFDKTVNLKSQKSWPFQNCVLFAYGGIFQQ